MLTQTVRNLIEAWQMPRLAIDLMHYATVDSAPFFGRTVREFYGETQRRHRKMPLVRALQLGVSVCQLPATFEQYLGIVEASARRNVRKAVRLGCEFRRIDYNEHRAEIQEIRQSAEFRQGKRVPDAYLQADIPHCTDPASTNPLHAYPYYGVFHEGKLRAYASCLVSGELCFLAHILGHADALEHGIVPLLIVEIARDMLANHPQVKYYAYGTYFGATPTMQRFKKKFGFVPHHVRWLLGDRPASVRVAAALARMS